MTLPTSRLAYTDCYNAFDQAVADRKGIRIRMPSQDKAIYYRMRLNQARKIDRRDNCEIYEEGHALHGRSAYDAIVIRLLPEVDDDDVPTGNWWLYLQKQEIIPGIVESLSEDEDDETTRMAPESNPRPAPGPVPESLDLGNWDADSRDESGSVDVEEAEQDAVRGT